jgi:hypothetical protein
LISEDLTFPAKAFGHGSPQIESLLAELILQDSEVEMGIKYLDTLSDKMGGI